MTKLPLESLVEEQALPERVSQVGGTARERKEYLISCESEVACNFLKKVPECFKSRFDRLER